MNYSDEILENKSFNFFKQLMYNIVVAICIILAVCLILVYGFKFRPYEVLSNSQAPYFTVGDMVIVKGQDSYEVGDIIKFDHNGEVRPKCEPPALMSDINNVRRDPQTLLGSTAVD